MKDCQRGSQTYYKYAQWLIVAKLLYGGLESPMCKWEMSPNTENDLLKQTKSICQTCLLGGSVERLLRADLVVFYVIADAIWMSCQYYSTGGFTVPR